MESNWAVNFFLYVAGDVNKRAVPKQKPARPTQKEISLSDSVK